MSSFFSDAEKAKLAGEIVNIAQTFERPIVVSIGPQKTIISTNINYNRFQANDFNLLDQNPVNTPISYTIQARILYDKQQPANYITPYLRGGSNDGQVKLPDPEGKVRIKVDESGMNIMKDSKQIEFDGMMFELDGIRSPHGLFEPQYYTFILRRTI